ncbi:MULTISPECIES: GGDEF domain-containing protein [Rhodococcus]|uniref:GGDEF domain-containing protein n=1 Tax=Rhodococcus TaxID=1827 RepID=UPI0002EA5B0F|nr:MULTISPECIES: GGDEF domain-containing protein [Rhodococcus]ATI35580.1 GGDEF domain-containing protein [Rhodococcus sp. H-CA8f]
MDRSTTRVRSSLIFVAILVVALAGIAARPPGFLSTFWPANAILLGILLRNPRSFAPIGLAVGGAALLTADLATGSPVQRAFELNAINLVGVTTGLIAANLLGCFPRRISETKYTTRIFVVSVLASFTAGSASALRTQLHEGSGAGTELVGWFFADLCTYLIVLPILLSAPPLDHVRRTFGPSVRQNLRLRRVAQILLPLAALLACLPLALEVQGALALLLPMPALLWCAMRVSLFSTSLLAAGWSAWALIMAGQGRLALADPVHLLSEGVTTRISVILMALSPIAVAVATGAQRRAERELQRIAECDALTGTLSRHAFWTQSQELLDTQHTARKSIAVMMLDLDHFKSINDNLGHLTGDSVLEQFGNTLLATTEGLGLSGRLGGEEFAVAAADCTFEEAIALAERIRQRQEAHSRSIRGFAGTVSIGVAWVDQAMAEMDALLDIADTAMYQAKREGRNLVVAVDLYMAR